MVGEKFFYVHDKFSKSSDFIVVLPEISAFLVAFFNSS
jgi:hypothetical protein